MLKKLVQSIFILCLSGYLVACGQSGSLYLPDNPPPTSKTTGH